MKNIVKHILIFSEQYPTKSDPVYAFVEQIAMAIARLDICVTVIAPQSLTKHLFRKTPLHPYNRIVSVDGGKDIVVYQPMYISLSNFFPKINDFLFGLACHKAYGKIKEKPQVCYGHFWRNAFKAFDVAKKNAIPLFVASGESKIEKIACGKKWNDFLKYCEGVIFVSSKNKKESETLGFLTDQNSIVLPNAINQTVFFKKDKIAVRRKYGFSHNDFIVAFVGAFIDRKGPQRVAAALKQIGDNHIKAFFIGSEKDGIACPFDYDGTLYKGILPHEKLVDYLNMADVFVLPTLAEGCCNAIIEAMACGLPIISSDLPFNDDILDDACSIRINPKSVNEIANAIQLLCGNPNLQNQMSKASLDKAASLTIENRAKKIVDFMNVCLGGCHHANMV